jgi:hypothetical protein
VHSGSFLDKQPLQPRRDRKVTKLHMCDFCRHLVAVLIHNFDKPRFTTLQALLLFDMLFLEKMQLLVRINLLILHTETRKHFLGLVHVFRHFMGLWKDIADQFDEVIVTVVREEIL